MRPLLVALLADYVPNGLARLVPTAALLYAAAAGAIVLLFIRRAGPIVSERVAVRCALAAFAGGVVGARLFYLVFVAGAPPRAAEWLSTTGTASWGAYLGVVAGLLLARDRAAAPALAYLDAAASCAPLGIALGRIGCFLNGDDFGRVTDLGWGVRFPAGSLPWRAHLADGLIPAGAALSLPVHPLQLYLALLALPALGLVSAVYRRRRAQPGSALAAFLLVDGSSRFLLEFLRAPAAGGSDAGLSLSQVMTLAGVSLGGVLYATMKRAPAPPLARAA